MTAPVRSAVAPPTTDHAPARNSANDWVLMALAFALTGVAQLATQMSLGRILGPADYGQVATLFNVMSFVGVPLVAVQLTVTGLVARGGSVTPTLVRYGVVGAVFGAVLAATGPWWGAGLAIDSVAATRIAALFLPAAFLVAVSRGNALGQGLTRRVAAAMSVGAVVRVAGSIVGALSMGPSGAVGAAVASELVIGLVLIATVHRGGEHTGAIVGRETAGATYTQVAMWLVVNVDLLWARRLLSPADAGRYLVVGSVAVGLVSFGQANLWHRASTSTDPDAGLAIVLRSALIVAVAAAIGVPMAIVGLPALLGPSYRWLTPLLAIAGVWAVAASIVLTGTATQLIAGRRGLRRLVPLALAAVGGPPLWVAVLGHRPIALSVATLVNTTVGAGVVLAGRFRGTTGEVTP